MPGLMPASWIRRQVDQAGCRPSCETAFQGRSAVAKGDGRGRQRVPERVRGRQGRAPRDHAALLRRRLRRVGVRAVRFRRRGVSTSLYLIHIDQHHFQRLKQVV